MGEAIVWWLTIELLGLVALPIVAAALRALPDRGYATAKIAGLLLVGWLAYTLAMTRLVPFGRPLLLVCALIVAGFSAFLLLRREKSLYRDLRERFRTPAFLRYVVTAEMLFTLAYAVWCVVRAYNPSIVDQEKFMDFGFLNAILKSGAFPPHDMWLAGFSINYYYFGYVLVAALTSLSGVATEIAFNLANATLFALTALGSFGVVYNLIAGLLLRRTKKARASVAQDGLALTSRRRTRTAAAVASETREPIPSRRARTSQGTSVSISAAGAVAEMEEGSVSGVSVDGNGRHSERVLSNGVAGISGMSPYEPEERGARIEDMPRQPFFLSPYLFAVLAALMVVAMGNLTTIFGIHDQNPAAGGNGWRYCFMCQTGQTFNWWAPSRVIMDYKTTEVPGQAATKASAGIETINEFPAFSFLLGDMHPHVLALPLVLLVISMALAFARRRVLRGTRWRDGVPGGLHSWLFVIISSIAAGSLYTTNTWDYPTYLVFLLGCMALPFMAAARRTEGSRWAWLRPWIVQTGIIVALSLAAFIPFHLTFKSLVGGKAVQLPENLANIPILSWLLEKLGTYVLVNTADKTILGFLVIFGIFLLGLLVWLVYEFASHLRARVRSGDRGAASRTLAVFAAFLLAVFLFALVVKFPLFALLLPVSVIAMYLVWQEPGRVERNVALLMLALSALIGLAIEVVFLRDNFEMRMNTLFKFYYQIWVMWGLVAAYAVWRTLHAAFNRQQESISRERAVVREYGTHPGVKVAVALWAGAFGLLVLSGLMYSVYGPMTRQGVGQGRIQGLDGAVWYKDVSAGDYEAISWLKEHGTGDNRVLEAGSNEYDITGRASSYTGVPTLLAWDNSHEQLWRTNQADAQEEIAGRRQAVNSIYQGLEPQGGAQLTPQRLLDLLKQYKVDYVFVGATERGVRRDLSNLKANEQMTDYGEALFKQVLPEAYRSAPYIMTNPRGEQKTVSTVIYSVAGANVPPGATPPVVPTATTTPAPGVDPNAAPRNLFETNSAGANKGQLNLPRGITQDGQGNFYVVDTQNMRIQKYDHTGKWLLMFGSKGTGDGQVAPMNDEAVGTGPSGIAVDASGNIYLADTWNHRIQKFDANGKLLTKWGSYVNLADSGTVSGPETNSQFFGPRGVAIGPDGNIYVTDTGNKRVLIFDVNGAYKRQISSGVSSTRSAPSYPFTQPGEMNEPIGIVVDAVGNVYVADTNNKRIQKFDAQGKFAAQWPVPEGSWNPGPYLEPFLALDKVGNIYATAPTGKSVIEFSPAGQVLGQKKQANNTLLDVPVGITLDPDGNVYVVDAGASKVVKLGTIP